jgi:hypothetical protein
VSGDKQQEFSCHSKEGKVIEPFCKNIWKYLRQLSMHSPYHPAIPILGVHPRDMNTRSHRKIYSQPRVRDGGQGNVRHTCDVLTSSMGTPSCDSVL